MKVITTNLAILRLRPFWDGENVTFWKGCSWPPTFGDKVRSRLESPGFCDVKYDLRHIFQPGWTKNTTRRGANDRYKWSYNSLLVLIYWRWKWLTGLFHPYKWSYGPPLIAGDGAHFVAKLGIFLGNPHNGTPSYKLPIPFPYFKGFLYGSGIGVVWEWGSHYWGSLEFPLTKCMCAFWLLFSANWDMWDS